MMVRTTGERVELWHGTAVVSLTVEQAQRLAGDLHTAVGQLQRTPQTNTQPLSANARRLLSFVHLHLELNRVAPTRQQMAEELGFADKKSVLGIIEELELAGWASARDGHRSDDFGGEYRRPMAPPFAHKITRQPNPQKGECVVAQGRLF